MSKLFYAIYIYIYINSSAWLLMSGAYVIETLCYFIPDAHWWDLEGGSHLIDARPCNITGLFYLFIFPASCWPDSCCQTIKLYFFCGYIFLRKWIPDFLRMHRKITLHLLLVDLILVAKLLNNILYKSLSESVTTDHTNVVLVCQLWRNSVHTYAI